MYEHHVYGVHKTIKCDDDGTYGHLVYSERKCSSPRYVWASRIRMLNANISVQGMYKHHIYENVAVQYLKHVFSECTVSTCAHYDTWQVVSRVTKCEQRGLEKGECTKDYADKQKQLNKEKQGTVFC